MATYPPTYPSAYQQSKISGQPQQHSHRSFYPPPPAGWVQPPYQGAPPIPPGVSVNPQQWQAGFWQYNPAYNQNRPQQPQQPQQQHVPWIPSRHWGPPAQQQQQQPQRQAQQQQQQSQEQSHNPYKRVPRPPSAEYLATKLVDNPLGLSNMIPAEELLKQNQPPEEVQTPWIWNPRTLADAPELPPGAPTQPLPKRTPVDPPSTPPAEPAFTSRQELKPTFSSFIVRTPEHYRPGSATAIHTSSPSSGSRTSSRGSRGSVDSLSASFSSLATSTSPTPLSRHSSMPNASTSPSAHDFAPAPPPPMLTDRFSDEPSSMLSPLNLAQTPKLAPASNLRPVRNHHSNPVIAAQPLSTIPEAPSAPGSSNLSSLYTHSNSLPIPVKGQYPHQLPAYPPPMNLPARDNTRARDRDREHNQHIRAGSRHTQATFIDAPSAPSPINTNTDSYSPNTPSPRSRGPSRNSSRPSSAQVSPVRHSGANLHTPPNTQHTPPSNASPSTQTPNTTSRLANPLPPPPQMTHRAPVMPIQRTPPPIWKSRVRHGFWNRRGDHLTPQGYIVYAPLDKAYPEDLKTYPLEGEGYTDHDGLWAAYVARPELPESLPRHGKAPGCPYEKSHTPKPINIGRWQKQDQDAKIEKFVATAVKVPHQFDPKDPKKQLIHWCARRRCLLQKDRWRSTSFATLKLDTDPKIEVQLNSQPYAVSSAAPYYWESELAKEYTTTQVYNLLVAKKFNHYLYNGTGSGCLTWTTALMKLLETEGVLPKGPEARFTIEVEEFRTDSNYWVPDEPGVKFYN
ncbi:hypothetical protein B0H34DRAFT_859416 [Crassisporium funariophilum]|nr:hypothetical protein B0H34DRAFT_859416 [Crassisporium funariophilum]